MAELRTRGEFVCVISDESFDYSEVPLLWAAGLALLAPLLPLTLFAFLRQIWEAFMGWTASPEISPVAPAGAVAAYAVIQCIAFVVILLLVSIPAVRHALTPHAFKRSVVRQRALEQFIGKGPPRSEERTGLLLYVSLKDRWVEVIADQGVNAKVTSGIWAEAVKALLSGVKRGRNADGLVAAIGICGRKLAKHFPAEIGNPNELPDGLTEIPAELDPL